jgi:hypothetical protein
VSAHRSQRREAPAGVIGDAVKVVRFATGEETETLPNRQAGEKRESSRLGSSGVEAARLVKFIAVAHDRARAGGARYG